MARTNVRKNDKGPGADFINERRAADQAVNERLRSEKDTEKLDPRSANNRKKVEHTPEVSEKKTGRSKH